MLLGLGKDHARSKKLQIIGSRPRRTHGSIAPLGLFVDLSKPKRYIEQRKKIQTSAIGNIMQSLSSRPTTPWKTSGTKAGRLFRGRGAMAYHIFKLH
ncbi:hypothetical protein HPP92_022632 [Vanilla planifolia]|uniref:Uncharacterized protein n=1 Tax=Vanilla planifolia TaxID=51239 RepID=A0A835PNW7_VANPL|nr:hypothetical protein HPP92_022632 [Vanilla planifolia]